MTELLCKYCGATIEEDNVIDINRGIFGSEIIEDCYGHCSGCGTQYVWSRVYDFCGYENLEEED